MEFPTFRKIKKGDDAFRSTRIFDDEICGEIRVRFEVSVDSFILRICFINVWEFPVFT